MSTSCPAASDSSSPSCPRGQWTQIFFCWMSHGQSGLCSHAAVKRDSACPEKAGQNAVAQRAPTLLSCRHCRRILGHGRRRDQRKIYCRRGKGVLSGAETNTFSAHARPCGDHRAGERAAAEKPRRRRLPSQMSAIHTAGRPEIPSLVSAFPSVSMRSSALWAQTAAAKRPSAS